MMKLSRTAKIMFGIAGLLLLTSISIVGCHSTRVTDVDRTPRAITNQSRGFNTEKYVWENFNYSTNKVTTPIN